jgi:hypothetical protein
MVAMPYALFNGDERRIGEVLATQKDVWKQAITTGLVSDVLSPTRKADRCCRRAITSRRFHPNLNRAASSRTFQAARSKAAPLQGCPTCPI